MFERYSERARRAIFFARYEALARGANEIEPKDIVLGLTHDEHQADCPFATLRENAASLRVTFGALALSGKRPENRNIPLTDTCKMILAYAKEEADVDRRYSIGTDHLLRGVLRAGGETAEKIASAGYTLLAVQQASAKAHRVMPDTVAAALSFREQLRRYSLPLQVIAAEIAFITALLYSLSKR